MDFEKINAAINLCVSRYEQHGLLVADDINKLFKEVGIQRVVEPHSHRDHPTHAVAAVHLRLMQLMIEERK